MTAHRSVWIVCDACEDEINARGDYVDDAMIIDGVGLMSAAALRAAAKERGWLYVKGRDICPEHHDAGIR